MVQVSSNQRLYALSPPLAQPVHHEEQQGEDEEGGDAAHDQAHSTGHGVKQAVAIWVQAGEFAALLGVLAVLLAALGPLTQGSHAHLGLPVVTRAAQTGIVPFGSEVVAFIHNVVFDINTSLTPFAEE